jgi:transglutaminase-like putative cysteine protease
VNEDGAVELGSGRGWWRALLTLVCVAAVLLASIALPLLATGGAPAAGFNLDRPLSGGSAASGSGGAGGLGALSPPDRMRVGSSSATESDTYSSLNREVHFTVESNSPAYWRTGAYDTYTGQGWEQTGSSTPLNGEIPVDGAAGERVSYRVTLERPARSLPTVWRPTALSTDRDGLRLGPARSVKSQQPLPAGTSYAGESVAPPEDPTLLRTAGTDYPEPVVTTYTTLPDREGTDRVAAFTDELTADAETPYETAVLIESWLESNKSYSLNASHDPEAGTITSEFVFDMDRGYCEYFATAMTTMLRSQDVPARYVVGYATGERTGPTEYTVRGMHAHAWVEVYFPDVGWVRFDPTPADERTAAEDEALGQTPTAQPTGTATGTATADGTGTGTGTATPTSPGPGTETTTATVTETVTSEPTPTPTADEAPLKVTLNRSAVPGATVEVTVTRDGEPVPSAEVLFNGDPIGITDPDGTVVGQVPYTEQLDITVRTDTAGGVPSLGERTYALDGYRFAAANETTYTLDTNASVSVVGDVRSNATVSLFVAVDDVPVRDAVVLRDGERIGRTDDRGGFELTLPSEPGEYEYTVERGSVRGNETVTIQPLELNDSVGWPVTVPFAPVTLNATLDGEPVADATVSIGGESVGTTDVDGTASLRLPATDSVTIAVAAHGQRAETEIRGLLATLGGIVAGLLVGTVALVGGAYRRGVTPRGLVATAGRVVLRGCRLILGGVVAIATTVSNGVRAVLDGLARAGERLLELARDLRARTKTPREIARIVADGVVAWTQSAAATVAAIPATVRAWLFERTDGDGTADSSAATDTTAEDPETAAARERIRAAWQRFVALLPLRRARTLTPGEIARIAVDDANLPAGPVERLRDAYRDVSYGGADPASRQDDAESAIESIDRDAADTDGASGPTESDGGESA